MDLSTTYLGMKLRTPLVPSASPLSEDLDNIKRMEDAGASAVVLHSLFEEQLRTEREELFNHVMRGTHAFSEALTFFPEPASFQVGPEEYLNHIRKAKQSVRVPIMASLNGCSVGGWIDFAKQIEQAGADALELNIYFIPTEMEMSGREVEDVYLDIFKAVKSAVKIPVAVKLSPFFSSMARMAKRLDDAGANALVLFNRFYQPDVEVESLEVRSTVLLSTPQALRLPLTWIGILYGKIEADLAATSGIYTALDVIKMLMAGANVTMLCSALFRYGIPRITVIENGLRQWMEEHEYESVEQMRGSISQMKCDNPSAYERAQYIRALQTYKSENGIKKNGYR